MKIFYLLFSYNLSNKKRPAGQVLDNAVFSKDFAGFNLFIIWNKHDRLVSDVFGLLFWR